MQNKNIIYLLIITGTLLGASSQIFCMNFCSVIQDKNLEEDQKVEEIKRLSKIEKMDINEVSHSDPYSGWTPLGIACWTRSIKIVRELLKHPKIDVNKDSVNLIFHSTPLNCALSDVRIYRTPNEKTEKEDLEIVQELLKHPKLDINKVRSDNGWTELHHACYSCKPAIVKELLSHKDIDVNKEVGGANADRFYLGMTPLYMACRFNKPENQLEIMKLLLEHGAIVDKRTMWWVSDEPKKLELVTIYKNHDKTENKTLVINSTCKNCFTPINGALLDANIYHTHNEKTEKESLISICKNCSICSSKIEADQEIAKLDCEKKHEFHKKCIEWWHLVRKTCPNCDCEAEIINEAKIINNAFTVSTKNGRPKDTQDTGSEETDSENTEKIYINPKIIVSEKSEKKVCPEKSTKKSEIDIQDIEVKI